MVHGGWWQEGSIDDAGRAALAACEQGMLFVSIGYSLAPERSLAEIVAEVAVAIEAIAAAAPERGGDPCRMVIGGHSAGAHLAACMVTELAPAPVREHIAGLLLISGAYDLGPVAESYVNDAVQMSPAEAQRLSPANLMPLRDAPVHMHVGARESNEFLRQSNLLLERWSPALSDIQLNVPPDRDHFDVLEELDNSAGSLFRDAQALLRNSVRP
jgi:arylformamidase